MGVIKRGILGGFSGSVGNVVGSSWKGIATMKAKPLSVANPNTAGQVAQRSKMSNLVAFAKQILTDVIKPLNDRFASGMSGFNLFTQRNIDLFAAANPSPAGDLVLSSGNVGVLADLVASASTNAGSFDLDWDKDGSPNSLDSDEVYLVAYNETINKFYPFIGVGTRDLETATFGDLAGSANGQTVRIWASCRRADGTQVSNTVATSIVLGS